MRKSLALVFALLAATTLDAQSGPPVGPVQTYVYSGCLSGRSCHQLTFEVTSIAYNGGVVPAARFFAEHWLFERTFFNKAIAFGAPNTVLGLPGGPNDWDDLSYSNVCFLAFVGCDVGYYKDSFNLQFGYFRIFDTVDMRALSPSIRAFDMVANDPSVGAGFAPNAPYTVPLTLTPEPQQVVLTGIGLAVLGVFARRHRASRSTVPS